jgi:hypothetical protein
MQATCAIPGCDRPAVTDHDHKTHDIRGHLCTSHNIGLGLIGDDVESVQAMLDYLLSPPIVSAAQIAELYKAGETAHAVADFFGVSRQVVSTIVRDLGISRNSGRPPGFTHNEETKAKVSAGMANSWNDNDVRERRTAAIKQATQHPTWSRKCDPGCTCLRHRTALV